MADKRIPVYSLPQWLRGTVEVSLLSSEYSVTCYNAMGILIIQILEVLPSTAVNLLHAGAVSYKI